MKKALFALCTAFLAAALAISASAADNENLPIPEVKTPAEVVNAEDPEAALSELFSSGKVKDLIRQTFLDAGYTEAAPNQDIEAQADFPDEVLQLAYSDLEQADEETRAAILKARKEITDRYDWHSDGVVLMTLHEGEFTILPSFEELFPDWDVPGGEPDYEVQKQDDSEGDVMPLASSEVVYDEWYRIPKNNPDVQASPMCPLYTKNGGMNGFSIWAETLAAGVTTYNLGVKNALTGGELGHARNLVAGKVNGLYCYAQPDKITTLSVRSSTNYYVNAKSHMMATRAVT